MQAEAEPLVSVIIPTYNYGTHVSRAIDSVLDQDYANVEVIVVDDGSSDGTGEIIHDRYGEKIRYFFQANQGVSSARNLGLKNAAGEFIVFLDADDRLEKSAISHRVACLREKDDFGWVYGPIVYHDTSGNDITASYEEKYSFAHSYARSGEILGYLLMGELIHPAAIMMRASLVRKVGFFREDLHQLEDFEFWLRAAAASPVCFVSDEDTIVLAHDDSASHSGNDNYKSLLAILMDAETHYPQHVKALGRAWQRRLSGVLVHRAMHLWTDGDVALARSLIQQAIRRYPWRLRNYYYWFRMQI